MTLPWCLLLPAGLSPILALSFAECDYVADDLHPVCLPILPLVFVDISC